MENDQNHSERISHYFESIERELENAYIVAGAARSKGLDPEDQVDVPLTKTLPERVESLIASVIPQLRGSGVAQRINELEKKYGAQAWETSMIIAYEVAAQNFCNFESKKSAIEAGIRTGFAYTTMGIVSAPLEGFIEVRFKKRRDGNEYFAMVFAGPVRGAGGTAAAVSLLIADYVRSKMGYSVYDANEVELARYCVELADYHERITNLQYNPSADEIKFLMGRLPIEIDGDPTEELEVSNVKDVPRVSTNRIRGGVCLVLSMLALKAPKIWKYLSKLPPDFGIDWGFLKEFIALQKRIKAQHSEGTSSKKLMPDYTYIADLVAGRPVLSYPLRRGGFRLRYGRSRLSGYSAAGVHPNSLLVLDQYIATGTQLKTERPGKAAAITPCDSIEGPIVRLRNGTVMRLENTPDRTLLTEIEAVLYLGDILISYGDFYDRAHPLVPAGYCEEWYGQELVLAAKKRYNTESAKDLSEHTGVEISVFTGLLGSSLTYKPSAVDAVTISTLLKVPLHPRHTYHFSALRPDEFSLLQTALENANLVFDNDTLSRIVIGQKTHKELLERMGVPHTLADDHVVLGRDEAVIFSILFGLGGIERSKLGTGENGLALINTISPIVIRDKGGTFIGARMGRPEKSKMRKLTGSPQVLFPVSAEGGRLRSLQAAVDTGKITAQFPSYFCSACSLDSVYRNCIACGQAAKPRYNCRMCGQIQTRSCLHGKADVHAVAVIDIRRYFNDALRRLGDPAHPDLIKGVRGTSNKDHVVEHLAKGILRAKHELFVNKDGTIRYDMSELPLTHFTPYEIGTPVEKLRALGYERDIYGKPLEKDIQIVEIFPQDIILPNGAELTDESASRVLFRITKFIDELLVRFYGQESYYNLSNPSEVVGQLVVGLAPHISAGIVGRVIGFSSTAAFFAHPYFHAAMRRDADGDEACVILLMDALLNFSRQFLPDSRGSRTMDAPLVLTARILPAEVDDMAHRVDVAWAYPLSLFDLSQTLANPWDVEVELLGSRLNTYLQYERMGYTHPVSNLNAGVRMSAYKTLETMEDKLRGQMKIAERVSAVDASDVARLVIEKHFLKDIKGNLRQFSSQSFRCIGCNEIFRRPPLRGKCTVCNGKLIFTVSEGSIVKYLQPALSLAKHYKLEDYTVQTLEITRTRVEEVFGKDTEKQEGLGKWFG